MLPNATLVLSGVKGAGGVVLTYRQLVDVGSTVGSIFKLDFIQDARLRGDQWCAIACTRICITSTSTAVCSRVYLVAPGTGF